MSSPKVRAERGGVARRAQFGQDGGASDLPNVSCGLVGEWWRGLAEKFGSELEKNPVQASS